MEVVILPLYRYRAIGLDGRPVVGTVSAQSRSDAVGRTRQEFPAVTGIRRELRLSSRAGAGTLFRPNDKTISLMCNRLSIVLMSGMPTVRAIKLTAAQSADRAIGGMLHNVAERMETGLTLAESFENSAVWIPQELVEVVRAGEESGSLAEAFASLQSYFEKRARVNSKITNSAIYPVIVLVFAVIAGIVVIAKVVPEFASAFTAIDEDFPLATRVLIRISEILTGYWLELLAGFVLLICALATLRMRRRAFCSRILLAIPLVGRLVAAQSAWQFSSAMSSMVAGGTPVTRALTVTSRAVTNRYIGDAVARLETEVEGGRSLGECMESSGAFPGMLTEMVYAGEEAGSLDRVLAVAAHYYEEEVSTRAERLLALLEPLMLLAVAGLVLMLVLAVYMPMLTLYGGI